MRTPLAALLCLLMHFPVLLAQAAAQFPTVTSEKLDKTRAKLPDDFTGDLDILVLYFQRDQEGTAQRWLRAATSLEPAHPQLKVYTLPVFQRENILSRWWTNASMRSTIKSPQWSTTIPLYVKRSQFLKDVHLDSEKQVAVLLAGKGGRIIWETQGDANPASTSALQAAVDAARRP